MNQLPGRPAVGASAPTAGLPGMPSASEDSDDAEIAASTGAAKGARASGRAERDATMQVLKSRHWGRWIAGAIVILFGVVFIHALASTPKLDWSVAARYLFDPAVMTGVRNTIIVTVVAQAIGIVGGLFLALARLSANPALRVASGAYIWFFRGVPVLVQLIFWFNLGLVVPEVTVSSPFSDGDLIALETNSLITPFIAVLLGLGLNEMAYMAEVIRGGLMGVPKGQREAALSLGMTPGQTLRKVVMPQAFRLIVPATSNQLIIMLKISALASVITYQDLLTSVQLIYSVNLRTLELLIVASFWYVVLTTVLTLGQSALEKYLNKSVNGTDSSKARPRRRMFRLATS